MQDYKEHIKEFFKFYSTFNFNIMLVSPYDGIAKKVLDHLACYEHFCFKGMYIAGPINRGKNCGIVDALCKFNFIRLCKSSYIFFEAEESLYEAPSEWHSEIWWLNGKRMIDSIDWK